MAIGNASSTLIDEWSLMHNPAGLSWGKGNFTNFSYLNHHFISDLNEQILGVGFRGENKALGLAVRQQGDHRLRESNISFVYSQLFASTFSMGISLNYHEFAFGDIYGSMNLIYGSFGFLAKIQKENYLSFHIINPSREFIDKKYNERLETIVSSGYSHYFSSIFSLITEVEKGLSSRVNFKTGFQYEIRSKISVLLGYEMAYRRISTGLIVEYKRTTTNLSISYESILGFRTGIGISYSLSSNK